MQVFFLRIIFIIEMQCFVRKNIFEGSSFSSDVDAMADRLFEEISKRSNSLPWVEINKYEDADGLPMKCKLLRINPQTVGLVNYASDIIVTLFGFDSGEMTMDDFKEYLLHKRYINTGFTTSKKVYLDLPWPYNGSKSIDNRCQGILLGTINHELMHAFQSVKRDAAPNITQAYLKSTERGNVDEHYVVSIVKTLYYQLDKDEICAHMQGLWAQLRNADKLEDSPTYNSLSYLKIWYDYVKKIFSSKYMPDSREVAENFIVNQMRISVKDYLNYVEKNYGKFRTAFNKIIYRWYELKQNHPQGSFRNYVAGEVPEGDKFNQNIKKIPFWRNAINDIINWIRH